MHLRLRCEKYAEGNNLISGKKNSEDEYKISDMLPKVSKVDMAEIMVFQIMSWCREGITHRYCEKTSNCTDLE